MVLKTLQLPCGQRDPNGVRAQRPRLARLPVTAEIYDDSGGVATIDASLHSVGGGYFFTFLEGPVSHNMTCVETTSTTSACTGTAIVHQYDLDNSSAGHQVQLRIFG
jgi:hypothetical protein